MNASTLEQEQAAWSPGRDAVGPLCDMCETEGGARRVRIANPDVVICKTCFGNWLDHAATTPEELKALRRGGVS